MKILKTKLNRFNVIQSLENGVYFLDCNGQRLPQYHIKSLVRIVNAYEKLFNVGHPNYPNSDTVNWGINIRENEHILNEDLFGMLVSFESVEELYNELYK